MGPFVLEVAIGAKPVDNVKALILLSHGIGGSELGHSVLAQALARISKHCMAEGSEDPIFCSVGRPGVAVPPPPGASSTLRVLRVRAIVAMPAAGVPLTAESLASVRPACPS
jgi:hypothetical protein